MTKKIILLVLILIAVVVVVLFASNYFHFPTGSAPSLSSGTANTNITVDKEDVPISQSPDSFPAGVPIETGAKIVQNYNATTNTGLFQATRVFETSKSLDENFKIYSDFINKNGWKLVSSLNQTNLKALAAQKDKGNLQVTLSENTQTKVRTVSVTYSEQR